VEGSEPRSLSLQLLPVEPESAPAARAETAPAVRPRYWRPPGMRLRPRGGDSYVVLDDLVIEEGDQVAILAVRPWPTVDDLGRLRFEGPGSRRLSVAPGYLQERVDAARSNDRALAPEVRTRSLRIGDTFLARALRGRSRPSWAALEDVTRPARDQAKVALFAAVALPVTQAEAETLHLTGGEEKAPRSAGPTAARPSI
jgi:hypothetical protein